jgi:SAM-dependent methyltransferase
MITVDPNSFVQRNNCPGCNSNQSIIIYQAPFTSESIRKYLTDFYGKQGGIDYHYLTSGSYVLAECTSCGLIFQKEILSDFLMEKLYEKWIDPKLVFDEEERTFRIDYYARYSQEIATLIAYFNVAPTQLKFLDFGMGWGKWLKLVQGFGVKTFGTELSESRINYARQFGINVISWQELANHKFDLINTEQVFEHIPNPLETLLHIKKSLNSGGLIKISVPNGSRLKNRLNELDWKAEKGSRKSFNPVSPLEHINCFSNNSIKVMADKAGLKQVIIPLHLQYTLIGGNTSIRQLLKNLIRPFYRNYSGGTYLFFTLA